MVKIGHDSNRCGFVYMQHTSIYLCLNVHVLEYFLGKIPMRHLVYRVQALSQSLLPLVWDFGTLKSKTVDGVDLECAYIRQMIIKFVSFSLLSAMIASL